MCAAIWRKTQKHVGVLSKVCGTSAMVFNGHEILPKIAPSLGRSVPHVTHGYLGPPHHTRQMACQSSQPSLQRSHSIINILYYGMALPNPKIAPSLGGILTTM